MIPSNIGPALMPGGVVAVLYDGEAHVLTQQLLPATIGNDVLYAAATASGDMAQASDDWVLVLYDGDSGNAAIVIHYDDIYRL